MRDDMSIGDWAKNSSEKLALVQIEINAEIEHRLERYKELNEALFVAGFYTKDMDKESIQNSLAEFISREKNQVIKEKVGEALRG